MPELYPYQHDAVKLIRQKGSALIAYEPGLGKTPITIRAMEQLMDDGKVTEPVLVIVLASLKFQWADEIEKFAPESGSRVVDGTPAQRDVVYIGHEQGPVEYLITTYDLIVRDYQWYAAQKWGAVILDEATAIKSFRAKRSKAVKALSSKVMVRVALTGTPITNGKAEEIFSLMEFVDPKVLGKFYHFDKRYIRRHPNGWVTQYRNMPELHQKLKPHIARKKQMDKDVASYLPEVLDMPPRLVSMDKYTQRVYRRISQDCRLALDEAQELFGSSYTWSLEYAYGQSDAKKFDPVEQELQSRIMSTYTALRMLCDHPQLLIDSAMDFQLSDGEAGSAYCFGLWQEGALTDTTKAPKLEALKEYLKDAVEADPDVKIVVFASFTRLFPHIAEMLSSVKVSHVEFHGGMNARAKDAAKKLFQKDPNIRVLLSSDAGGYGVDLPQASILINYNLPWSAGTALQRNSRIIRASSEHKQVRVERLLISNSVEIRQWEMLEHKMKVAGGVVDGVLSDPRGNIENTVAGLRSFLLQES